mgnify:CR=1 FL=1|jgi:hypothetical protein
MEVGDLVKFKSMWASNVGGSIKFGLIMRIEKGLYNKPIPHSAHDKVTVLWNVGVFTEEPSGALEIFQKG